MNTQKNLYQKADKKNENGSRSKKIFPKGSELALVVALGESLETFFAPKEGAEIKKDIIKKARELAKKFKKNRKEMKEILRNIFGEVTQELEESYLKLQEDILAKLDDVKDDSGLTQKKYNGIVKDVVINFSKEKKWAKKSVDALIKKLQKDLE